MKLLLLLLLLLMDVWIEHYELIFPPFTLHRELTDQQVRGVSVLTLVMYISTVARTYFSKRRVAMVVDYPTKTIVKG